MKERVLRTTLFRGKSSEASHAVLCISSPSEKEFIGSMRSKYVSSKIVVLLEVNDFTLYGDGG